MDRRAALEQIIDALPGGDGASLAFVRAVFAAGLAEAGGDATALRAQIVLVDPLATMARFYEAAHGRGTTDRGAWATLIEHSGLAVELRPALDASRWLWLTRSERSSGIRPALARLLTESTDALATILAIDAYPGLYDYEVVAACEQLLAVTTHPRLVAHMVAVTIRRIRIGTHRLFLASALARVAQGDTCTRAIEVMIEASNRPSARELSIAWSRAFSALARMDDETRTRAVVEQLAACGPAAHGAAAEGAFLVADSARGDDLLASALAFADSGVDIATYRRVAQAVLHSLARAPLASRVRAGVAIARTLPAHIATTDGMVPQPISLAEQLVDVLLA